jgi:NADPH:quinone reductase-like Zn-dependent oxidoreductase
VVFDVLAHPINPADLALLEGRYAVKPPLPMTPGAECIGRIVAVGAAVTDLKPGDRVINMQRENWAQKRRVKAADAIKVRDDIPVAQAAMLRINPPTAQLLLEDVAVLKPGDWVIQNGANSAVGKILIGLARDKGLRTINVVRRIELAPLLKQWGAELVIADGPDLAARIGQTIGGQKVSYAIDCVGGDAVHRLADALADGGTVCNYGGLSGQDCAMPTHALIYRGLTLTGFMLGRFLAKRSRAQIVEIYNGLAGRIHARKIDVPVEKIYPIERIAEAVAHAAAYKRSGKILVAPNGPID